MLHPGLQTIVVAGLVHQGIGDEYRATSESIVSMADSLIIAATAPATMVLGDVWGIEWAIATSCVLYGIVVALAYVGPMRVRTKASERVGAS